MRNKSLCFFDLENHKFHFQEWAIVIILLSREICNLIHKNNVRNFVFRDDSFNSLGLSSVNTIVTNLKNERKNEIGKIKTDIVIKYDKNLIIEDYLKIYDMVSLVKSRNNDIDKLIIDKCDFCIFYLSNKNLCKNFELYNYAIAKGKGVITITNEDVSSLMTILDL